MAAPAADQKEDDSVKREMVPARLTASFCSPFCGAQRPYHTLNCGACEAVFYTCDHAMERIQRAATLELHPLCPPCSTNELQLRLRQAPVPKHVCELNRSELPTCPVCLRVFCVCAECRNEHVEVKSTTLCTMCSDAFI